MDCISFDRLIIIIIFLGKPYPQAEKLFTGTQDLFAGQQHSFVCLYYSNPINKIDWFKDGTKVTHIQYATTTMTTNASISLTQSTLTILNAGPDDRANYSCQAENKIGASRQTKFLNVLCKYSVKIRKGNRSYKRTGTVADLDVVIALR